jgi:hypothetical protein
MSLFLISPFCCRGLFRYKKACGKTYINSENWTRLDNWFAELNMMRWGWGGGLVGLDYPRQYKIGFISPTRDGKNELLIFHTTPSSAKLKGKYKKKFRRKGLA